MINAIKAWLRAIIIEEVRRVARSQLSQVSTTLTDQRDDDIQQVKTWTMETLERRLDRIEADLRAEIRRERQRPLGLRQ